MADEKNKTQIRHLLKVLSGTADPASVEEMLAPTYTLHKPGFSAPAGPVAFTMYLREWRSAFPDYEVEPVATLADSDYVCSLVRASGTHTGTWLGTPATGRSFAVTGSELHRFARDQLAESWFVDDVPRLLMDTGVLVPRGGTTGWT